MDRNVANTDGNTQEKLAQHADRSGAVALSDLLA
jgi:hypothetical protein